ncbi:Gti1/Pac2 family-domain-containing protein [Exophiala viscosa]|uniref:Gti1/Pac2 family-domain-containing protein n=1 Tax=Exophiala viscosa TaxID=2486360 RepID=A0AAN6E060_9EURO|nr:Gti1/Pac2 family-domain-containing protein [Exophiala viscosa]
MQPGSDFQPSFYGFVETRNDTMIVIQACLQGRLHFVQRRATPSERPFVAQSGHVFVYEVKASGIQRWTDGVHWSPSRTAETEYEPMSTKDAVPHRHKELYGPLAKSFNFKAGELVKKTISIKESGNSGTIWHVVSYYRSLDVLQDLLRTPSMDQHCGRQI